MKYHMGFKEKTIKINVRHIPHMKPFIKFGLKDKHVKL